MKSSSVLFTRGCSNVNLRRFHGGITSTLRCMKSSAALFTREYSGSRRTPLHYDSPPCLLGLCGARSSIVVEAQLVQDIHRLLVRILEVHGHLRLELAPTHLRDLERWRPHLCRRPIRAKEPQSSHQHRRVTRAQRTTREHPRDSVTQEAERAILPQQTSLAKIRNTTTARNPRHTKNIGTCRVKWLMNSTKEV